MSSPWPKMAIAFGFPCASSLARSTLQGWSSPSSPVAPPMPKPSFSRPPQRVTLMRIEGDDVPVPPPEPAASGGGFGAWFKRQRESSAAMRAKLRSYGVAAVISYGICDAVTYSISFLLAMRTYIAAGKIVTLQTLPQLACAGGCLTFVVMMPALWCLVVLQRGYNNFSRPLRVAVSLALAPRVDKHIVIPARRFLRKMRA